MLGTDQIFDYLIYKNYANISELMDLFLNAGFLHTIIKPTRITDSTATLIDNIYFKTSKEIKLASGIIFNKISEHLPVFLFSGKYEWMKPDHLIFEHRQFNNHTYQHIWEALKIRLI